MSCSIHQTSESDRPANSASGGTRAREAEAGGALDTTEIQIALAVFVIALAVRLYYLHESSANPTFLLPIVDSKDYHLLAWGLADGRGMVPRFFWQPFFYPFTLAGLYLLAGPSILAAKFLQVILGSVTCVLTYRLGQRVFDRRTGLIAGLMTALCGPLIFYEGELIAAGWAAFWSLVLMILFLRTAAGRSVLLCFLLGMCGALATMTRPTFLPFFLVGCLWLAVTLIRGCKGWTAAAGRLAALLVGFLTVATPAAVQCYRVVGHAGILPTSGGLNVYIGNNANRCETLTLRPGPHWDELVGLPAREGCQTAREKSQFFYAKVWDFALDDPLAFAEGLTHKAVQFANGREVPRNLDVYVFHEWSGLLRILVWKAGGFGFPWGVLFPLAALGLVCRWRQVPTPVALFVTLYPLAIILVFVAGRYRVALVPVMSILAAAGCLSIIGMLRTRRWLRGAIAGSATAGLILLTSLPGSSCEEEINYASEMYALVGKCVEEASGDLERAKQLYRKALSLDPASTRAHNNLGNVFLKAGALDQAIAHYDEALRLRPDYVVYYTRGQAYLLKRAFTRALHDFDAAIALNPRCAPAYCNRGTLHYQLGQYERARRDWEQVLEITETGPTAEYAKSQLRRMRQGEEGDRGSR